ncbi:glycogen synthase [Desulfobacter curvatus]|uniref:glycogen synthase n=1 Tax=Desulfobacter curvatus TaxID=2290 RepID=UPI000366B9D5|nr:glycogen/starch synthase [Desulfobacter curvatus]
MHDKARILIVTPEVTYLPEEMGSCAGYSAKAGGLADVSAALISSLFDLNCDVHVAIPDYHSIYHDYSTQRHDLQIEKIRQSLNEERIHFAVDRAFLYKKKVYSGDSTKNLMVSLAFQREVINNIIPRVKPDIIHCNDWMTGLIPAMARQYNIPCLFSIHNIHTMTSTLAEIEDRGIDAASFWQWLYFQQPPESYEQSRISNRVDFLCSGVFSAHYVNTVSPSFLQEIVENRHAFVAPELQAELAHKWEAECATGILNAPEPEFNPAVDNRIEFNYGPKNHRSMKQKNKISFQDTVGLEQNPNVPLFFWPSRLDPVQKGCQLLSQIMYHTISRYWETGIQIVSVADGPYYKTFRDIAGFHGLRHRIAILRFDEEISHQAFAASDFVFMPSSFEPCGLPQIIGAIYGSLPIAFDTGGLHDTVTLLDPAKGSGNGFVFTVHDTQGLNWAIDRAMDFFALDPNEKETQIRRIMIDSVTEFNHSRCAQNYINLYEKMLQRPFLVWPGKDTV